MRNLQAAGLGDLVAPPEPLRPACELALHCWGWCDGWAPERWPVYEALFPVPDWHHHIELLRVIRRELQAKSNPTH
jgi:hypothetical protein